VRTEASATAWHSLVACWHAAATQVHGPGNDPHSSAQARHSTAQSAQVCAARAEPSDISSIATWQERTLAAQRWTAWAQGGGKVSPTVESTDSQATMHLRQAKMQASYGVGKGEEEDEEGNEDMGDMFTDIYICPLRPV
jgi:hypothetical protein